MLNLPSFVLQVYHADSQRHRAQEEEEEVGPGGPGEEVTPEKDDAPEVDDEAPDEHMLEMIEGLADLALELVVEELIDVDEMVETADDAAPQA